MTDKPWGGRFDEELDGVAARINASVERIGGMKACSRADLT